MIELKELTGAHIDEAVCRAHVQVMDSLHPIENNDEGHARYRAAIVSVIDENLLKLTGYAVDVRALMKGYTNANHPIVSIQINAKIAGVITAFFRKVTLYQVSTETCRALIASGRPVCGFDARDALDGRLPIRRHAPKRAPPPAPEPMSPEERERERARLVAAQDKEREERNASVLERFTAMQREGERVRLSVAERNLARAVWSAQLRAKVAASAEADKAREPRVVLQGNWPDDEENL